MRGGAQDVKTLKKGADYTVSYKNNKAIGTATVTVAGKGDYKGAAKGTFKINPKAVTGLKLAAGKGKLTASWKKPAGGVGGYQLQYALKKSFSGGKKVTVSKASTLKAPLKKLKAGKTYYVRIRIYKKVGKTTYKYFREKGYDEDEDFLPDEYSGYRHAIKAKNITPSSATTCPTPTWR